MNKLKWNAGQIVNDTNEYELAQYPATDKPKYLVDYDFKDMEIARLNNIIDELEKYLIFKKDNAYELENPKKSKLKPYGVEKDMYHISYCRYYEILDKLQELKEEGKE